MKKSFIIPITMLLSLGASAQGLYNNGGKINIPAGVTLYVSGTGGNYLNETSTIDGAISLGGTLKLDGNYTNNVAGSDILSTAGAGSTVAFTGTAGQTLGGTSAVPFAFNGLTIGNSSGVTFSRAAIVSGILTLTSGHADIGNNDFVFGPSATVAGSPSASAMIVATGTGQVKKQYSAIGSFTFPVGDNNITAKYSPVTLNFTSGAFAAGAYAGVNLVNAPYSDPYIVTSYLNRYWNLSQSGITGFSCDAAFNYNTSDVVGTESDIYCIRINPAPVSIYNPSNTVLHQLTAPGLTSFGSFTGALGIKYLNLTLFLEGLYNGAGTMRQAQGAAGNQFPGTTADQISVELHDPVTYANTLYAIGNINLSASGLASIQIPSNFGSSYYVTVRNRNHIATVTAAPVALSTPTVNYNFTTSAAQAFGSNLKTLEPGIFGIYGGDANGDGVVDALDLINTENDAFAFLTGYVLTDLNGDGVVDALDLILGENNAFNFVATKNP
ncbi:MAG: hypothetical protein WCI71_11660 [Bacteroidota bacterium]